MNRTVIFFTALLIPVLAYAAGNMNTKSVSAKSAWTRTTVEGVRNGAAYMTLKNETGQDDVLIGASSTSARKVEIHESKLNELGVYTMNKITELPVKSGEEITFSPGGLHLMLVGLNQPLEVGNEIAVKLEFAKSQPINVRVAIESSNHQVSPTEEMMDHGHHGH